MKKIDELKQFLFGEIKKTTLANWRASGRGARKKVIDAIRKRLQQEDGERQKAAMLSAADAQARALDSGELAVLLGGDADMPPPSRRASAAASFSPPEEPPIPSSPTATYVPPPPPPPVPGLSRDGKPVYSFTEKKRVRRDFSSGGGAADIPSLLETQIRSYADFLQAEASPAGRVKRGLQEAFETVFPIQSSNGLVRLEFLEYRIEPPEFDIRECKERGLTYQSKLRAKIRMVFFEKDDRAGARLSARVDHEPREQEVHMGEIPLMTETGSFIINGTERVVVSQLHRSPGVFFEHDAGRTTSSGKFIYSARVIPYNGSWLDFEFDQRDHLYFRIDRRRKMYVTTLLFALGWSGEEIIEHFHRPETFVLGAPDKAEYRLNPDNLIGMTLPFDIPDGKGGILIPRNTRIKQSHAKQLAESEIKACPVEDEFIFGWRRRRLYKAVLNPRVTGADGEIRKDALDAETGEIVDPETGKPAAAVLAEVNEEITEEMLARLREAGVREIHPIYTNDIDCGGYISETMAADEKRNRDEARIAIYRMLRPGDPPSPDVVNNYFEGLFFSKERYNLSAIGRMKLNRRLGLERGEMEYRVAVYAAERGAGRRLADNLRAALGWDGARAARFAERALQYRQHKLPVPVLENIADKEEAITLAAKLVGQESAAGDNGEAAAEVPAVMRSAGIEAVAEEQTTLSREDILGVVKIIVNLRNGKGRADDIDSLGNRRVRSVGEFVKNHFQAGLLRVERAIRDRLSQADRPENRGMMPTDLISAKTISQAVAQEFFTGSQLSQFMDQTNPLSEITHKRRVSALGPGGLARERAGFEVRDVHPTHYGRLCPIETPEGPNIGLINSMALYARVNRYGFLETPYRRVRKGRVTGEIVHLSAVDEVSGGVVVAEGNSRLDAKGNFADELVSCRREGEYVLMPPAAVDYMDVAPAQIASAAASLIPFLEHDDANRALMGSNMQRQAVPCLRPDKPLIGTGIERKVAVDSCTVLRARRGGVVDFVDAGRVVIRVAEEEVAAGEAGVDIASLTRYARSNQNTIIRQRPVVREGDVVAAGDVIADGAATDLGELALGQNMLVAFLPWNGYNYEDSILISERVVAEERFSSIHIEEYELEARSDLKIGLGREEITRDIPNQSEQATGHLDESGIVHVGTEVHPGDILVGKVSPKSERQLTPEEKLLQAIFGEKAYDVKDTSLRLPPGSSGIVIDVKVFTARNVEPDARAQSIIDEELARRGKDRDDTIRIVEEGAFSRIRRLAAGQESAAAIGGIKRGDKIGKAALVALDAKQLEKLRVADAGIDAQIEAIRENLEALKKEQQAQFKVAERKLKSGAELKQNVLKKVKVYVAIKRNLQAGDKMAGRHGNKGVVSKVVPVEDMPYLDDGTPVDIVLNPLGVPSRMNVGQILEIHLGLAAKALGDSIAALLQKSRAQAVKEIRAFLGRVYNGGGGRQLRLSEFSDDELLEMARNLKDGVPFATPIFDGAQEAQIKEMLKAADMPESGQMRLRDGRTGEYFARAVTVGHMYMLKLHHLVDDKMHARATGPYSLVTQQPLGGKAQQGGQRFGEMEVWALEAYGAAYTLREMLTAKSDDIAGRAKTYENIAQGKFELEAAVPESFNVLVREIRALGVDMDLN